MSVGVGPPFSRFDSHLAVLQVIGLGEASRFLDPGAAMREFDGSYFVRRK